MGPTILKKSTYQRMIQVTETEDFKHLRVIKTGDPGRKYTRPDGIVDRIREGYVEAKVVRTDRKKVGDLGAFWRAVGN